MTNDALSAKKQTKSSKGNVKLRPGKLQQKQTDKHSDTTNLSQKIAKDILNSIIDDVVTKKVTKRRSQVGDDRAKKFQNRKTKVFVNDAHVTIKAKDDFSDVSNRESLYSLEEDDEEHEAVQKIVAVNTKLVSDYHGKQSSKEKSNKSNKSSFLNTVFRKKLKSSETEVPPTSPKLTRTTSLRAKLTSFINKDGPGLLKRSLSFRDLSKRLEKDKSREKLSEIKNREWASSLQSLVESDFAISYKDLSFINYDFQNEISYTKTTVSQVSNKRMYLQRAKSFQENSLSASSYRSNASRGTSYTSYNSASSDFSDSGASSLPSLQHLHLENVDFVCRGSYSVSDKRSAKLSSACSDECASNKFEPVRQCSFKSAGNGCIKLKRQNACRQKPGDFNNNHAGIYRSEQTVRSKSLTHLDDIEMRQSTDSNADICLKDSRSEPDCTKGLLVPPGQTSSSLEPAVSSIVEQPLEPETPIRKHVLSRSQKSSSECFSVNFEVGDKATWDTELFFPAIRGVTVHDSLSKLCELRSIDINGCDAWLQDKDSNTNTWLPLSQDTACLVGKHVRITAKDLTSNKKAGSVYGTHSWKPSSSNSKSRTASFFNSSIEDSSSLSLQDADASKKQVKQRWSGFFSNAKGTRMEMLVDQLNNYSKNGIPYCEIYPQGQVESIDALYKLEGDWRHIINAEDLTEKTQQQQTALWELIKTEAAYIKTLKVVTDLFLACLQNLQSVNLLKEIDTEKLFSNITEILDANVLFWRNWIFPLVRDMRYYKQPPCLENMLQGFLKISDTFQAYFRYCAEQARCQHYCRESHTHNELFTAYLAWCETQKECNRLRLMDILVQPMQRLTKYGLLLKAILRNTDDDVERDNLNLMIKSMDEFVNNVNFSLKQKQDNERLKGIIARIESYDAVETKDDDLEKLLKSFNQLDLNKPMIGCPPERKRHLLLEGDLKLKDNSVSKMEVHCFLLTDVLLVCKSPTKRGGATMRIIRQPYLIDRLEITELTRETPSLAAIYKNEFDLPVAAFILQNNDSKKLKSWKESIAKAQYLYTQAKQVNYIGEENLETDYIPEYNIEGDYHSFHLIPRSPIASSSRASRVSSLAHSHSGSVEMNDQSSTGSAYNQSRAVSVENENRTASISSDEGVQALPPDKSPVTQKMSFKHRIFNKTPNTLSVQPYGSLGQSLPNLVLGSPNVGTLSLNLNQNTLSVPNAKGGGHLLSPTSRGVSYPPPSPTRGNLRRGLAISQNKNPPLLKTRHITSTASASGMSDQVPTSFDFDVPVIAATSSYDDSCGAFSRDPHRQAMLKRTRNDNKRYHTAGVIDDIKHNDNKDSSILKRLSWNSATASVADSEDPT